MTEFELTIGETTSVVVTKELPYGVLVESTSGLPGMVTGAKAELGVWLRVKVTAVEHDKRRFAAVAAA